MKSNFLLLGTLTLAPLFATAQNVETRAFYATNPTGAVGKYGSITIDGNFSDWSEDMIIARNGANNVSTAYKGSHENNVLDIYSLYAAWDDTNLYVAWQMCNTGDVWAREGDGPLTDYGKIGNVPLILALSVNPSTPGMTGLLEDGRAIWCDQKGNGTTFDPTQVHVDHMLFMSAQPGQGEPAMFKAVNTSGSSNYVAGKGFTSFSQAGITYNKADGFQPSELWRCRSTAEWYTPTQLKSDPSVLNDIYDETKYDNLLAGPIAGLKNHDTKFDTFFEIKIPLASLGITRGWLEDNGIGARIIATRGESALDCCPFDPSMVDNTFGEYGKDNSTTHEKDDLDVITYAMADIAKIRDLSNIDPLPTPDPTPGPAPDGAYTVYYIGSHNPAYVYLWDKGNGDYQFAGAWPGATMIKTTIDNKDAWVYSFNSDSTPVSPMVIFNNGNGGNGNQTADLEFVNNGVYDDYGFTNRIIEQQSAIETIERISESASVYYDIQGNILTEAPAKGLYIKITEGKAYKILR